ncbi:transposase [Aliiglaciecola sp. 3_MG-2023]|uniref:transposase n=1 Tax=Aliiglaciecola sp. 3_MG-2023 TaxID=3062644 RepID=UPI0026E33B77|nr:transposase [Aliiglaciecola sp. 3_MG-2023]MDO6695581.1 transposase [Aliiglaciecola sp. 3_MG-2023]
MALARKHQVSLVDTSYYHCVSRCVRRAYLCGRDAYSGKNYEHRRRWVEDRLLLLAHVFCIDICAYAVMSNHIHVVLHVNKSKALSLSDREVVENWHKIHKPTHLAQQSLQTNPPKLNEVQLQTLKQTISIYRQRLFDISWFMRELNEPIARRANREDQCTGHFWEGRFKSQALLDEKALAACMVYVDLNPIRASTATTLEMSHHTSIKRRLKAFEKGKQPPDLMPFLATNKKWCLPFCLSDYVSLVKTTAEIPTLSQSDFPIKNQPNILTKLQLVGSTWYAESLHFESIYNVAAGSYKNRQQFKKHTNRKRMVSVDEQYY